VWTKVRRILVAYLGYALAERFEIGGMKERRRWRKQVYVLCLLYIASIEEILKTGGKQIERRNPIERQTDMENIFVNLHFV